MSANDDDADEARAGAFMRALQRIVAIEPSEMRSIAWSWLYFFSLLASTFVLRPLRDSMGLNGGADKYPWLFTGTLVAMVVVSPPFALLVTKLPRKRFIPIVYRVSIACLFAFWLALKFLPESFNLAAAYTFFVWFSVFNLFVVSVFR
jgi:AAA family ATP:ADP antiporter